MATSGDRRPRRARGRGRAGPTGLGPALLLGVLLVAAGCTGGTGTAPSPGTAPSATSGATGVPSAAAAAGPPCVVALPQAWADGLRAGVVAPRDGETLTVALGLGDGSVFAVSDVPGVRHALVWRRAGAEGDPAEDVVVQDLGLDHPEWQVLGATFDGRHLAYRVDRSYASFEDFALYVWDSRAGGRPVEVAHGEKDAQGHLMQTPFVDPVLAEGSLWWTQTRDADPGRTVLSARRLADGRVERVSRGYGRAPVRFGRWLVWADSPGPGQTSALRAVDLVTREPVELPAPLAAVRGPFYLAGDATTLTWVAGRAGDEVWVWRQDWPEARLLASGATGAQFPRVAGDTIVWTGADATWAGDLRSGSTARLTPSYGGVWADGGPVVTVGFAPEDKAGPSEQVLLDTAAAGPLGRAGC